MKTTPRAMPRTRATAAQIAGEAERGEDHAHEVEGGLLDRDPGHVCGVDCAASGAIIGGPLPKPL